MKKILYIFLISIFCHSHALADEVIGFDYYNAEENTSTCESFCLVSLGNIDDFDSVSIRGNFTGSGVVGLAFSSGDELQGIVSEDVSGNISLDKQIPLGDIKKQISGVDLYIFQQGQISANSQYTIEKYSIWQKMKKGIFSPETFAPYSINLRYGKMYENTSLIYILYGIFVIGFLLLIVIGKMKREYVFGGTLVLFAFLACINLLSFYNLYSHTSQDFEGREKYHNMGDYFAFTQSVHESIGLDNTNMQNTACSYYSQCFSHWPYCYYWKSLYMKPCKNVDTPSDADYVLLYKVDIPEELSSREVLFSKDGNYLLK